MDNPDTRQTNVGGGTGVQYPDSGTGLFDSGVSSDAGTDGGLGLGYPCDPVAPDNGGCAPDLTCEGLDSATGFAYSCQPGVADDAG